MHAVEPRIPDLLFDTRKMLCSEEPRGAHLGDKSPVVLSRQDDANAGTRGLCRFHRVLDPDICEATPQEIPERIVAHEAMETAAACLVGAAQRTEVHCDVQGRSASKLADVRALEVSAPTRHGSERPGDNIAERIA